MRRLVTGIDDDGRSRVVSDVEVEFAVRENERGVVAVEQLYATDELPPRLQPAGKADRLHMGVALGLAWMIIDGLHASAAGRVCALRISP
jgi:hypothetical protein